MFISIHKTFYSILISAAHLATLVLNWKEDGDVFKGRKKNHKRVSQSLNPLIRFNLFFFMKLEKVGFFKISLRFFTLNKGVTMGDIFYNPAERKCIDSY